MSASNLPKRTGTGMFIAAWVIMLGLFAWYFGMREEERVNPNHNLNILDDATVVLEKNSYDQYIFTGKINNRPVTFLVDTGATSVTVSEDLARELGLNPLKEITITTASGYARAWLTILPKLEIGKIQLTQIEAIINPSMPSNQALLGMTALQHIDFRQEGNTLILDYSR